MDAGPISLVYYTVCAVPGAAAGLVQGLSSRRRAGGTLIAAIAGALGGMGGGALVATVPTQPTGSGLLFIAGLILFTAFCGWLLAVAATRLLRRRSA
jgi:uncharacterized membrane protein YeaQ/YmgE (transglycosylase-associated protein family)